MSEPTVYTIAATRAGLSNDVFIKATDGAILYNVKSKLFSPMGRVYKILDSSSVEVLRTEQDHTAVFPRHSIFEHGTRVGKVGQAGILPRNYFVDIRNSPRAIVHLGGHESVLHLQDPGGVLAEIRQERMAWHVTISTDRHSFLILAAIGMLYREDALTG
jgi:uncharacterized protein YxjI